MTPSEGLRDDLIDYIARRREMLYAELTATDVVDVLRLVALEWKWNRDQQVVCENYRRMETRQAGPQERRESIEEQQRELALRDEG